MSINQSNIHKTVNIHKTENNRLFNTAVGTECQGVVRFMRPWTPDTRRLDLRPRKCPPQYYPHIQDPGSAVKEVLFLGLFDVTRCCRVAVGTLRLLFGTVWHCFDTVWYSISLDGRYTGPKLSKTGTKFSKMRSYSRKRLGNLIELLIY